MSLQAAATRPRCTTAELSCVLLGISGQSELTLAARQCKAAAQPPAAQLKRAEAGAGLEKRPYKRQTEPAAVGINNLGGLCVMMMNRVSVERVISSSRPQKRSML